MDNGQNLPTPEPMAEVPTLRPSILEDVARQTVLRQLQAHSQSLSLDNFDPADIDDQFAKLAAECCEQRPIFDFAKMGPLTIKARYIALRQSEQTSRETGEVVSKNRTIIVDDEGIVWATSSPVAERVSMAILGGVFGRCRFDPPLPIKCIAQPTANGGKCLALAVDRADLSRLKGASHGS